MLPCLQSVGAASAWRGEADAELREAFLAVRVAQCQIRVQAWSSTRRYTSRGDIEARPSAW